MPLPDFEQIRFCTIFFIWLICPEVNQIDAAIAATSESQVGTSTPSDGYGTPNASLHAAYGDPAVIGDETLSLLLGEPVYKYGRTTGLTPGTVDGINATVDVCYDQSCSLIARFVDQIIITPGTFSAGGDSGSLIVTQNDNNPVGLLFAGSTTNTIANRIDLVLNRFGVSIDDGGSVAEVTDIAITDISVSANPVVDESTDVVVTVENVGNQDVGAFEVILTDETEGFEIGRQTVGFAPDNPTIEITFPWTPGLEGPHTLRAYHEVSDDNAGNDDQTTEVNVVAEALVGPVLQLWQGWVSTDTWTTVTLDQDYGNEMVVVCTPNYDRSATGPAVARVRNATGTSFDVGLARPWFGAFPGEHWSVPVHCMVVRAGVYTEAEHGVKMEAARLENFTSTDNSGSWAGEPQSYVNNYTTPVVVGQVIGGSGAIPGEIGDWSVFWSRGTRANRPPSSNALYVGRHTGEDPTARPRETIGYIVIEAGTGTMGGVRYTAGLGSDTVRGVSDSPPYSYALNGLSSASTAILSQAGMDSRNDGWAILYGSTPVTATQVNMAIEEDWYLDSERRHTTEQINYFVFE